MSNMYDENGMLRPEYAMTDNEKSERYMNYDGPKDVRTDFGKGLCYLTCDGKECATMEEVMQYNQMYYAQMMNSTHDNNDFLKEKGMPR